MAAWLSVIKVVLPYVGPIVSAAFPAFTKNKNAKTDPVVAQQISELQEAVKNNSESVKALARAVEESARTNDAAIRQARLVAVIAAVTAMVSFVIVLAAWFA